MTLTTGVCLQLFDITKDSADEYQKIAFASVLIVSIAICLLMNVILIILSTECLRNRFEFCCSEGKAENTKSQTAVLPVEFSSDENAQSGGRAQKIHPDQIRDWKIN